LPVAIRAAEPALSDTSRLRQNATKIWQRVSNFKAHQEKMARQREDYYLQIRSKILAPMPILKQPDARSLGAFTPPGPQASCQISTAQ